jgi:hypothetical protein
MVSTALFGALAFDGALLGFQYVGLGERCQLCMAVGLGLMLILLQFSLVRRSFFIFILGLALWCSGFAANSVLKLDPVPPKIQETAFLTWPQELDPWEEYPAFHLFIGLHCGHCSKVLANLAVNDLEFFPWSFHLMDNREQDFVRIANILADNSTRDNPFQAVLDVEKMSVHDLAPEVLSKDIRKKVENARDFFRFSGYQGVPMLIVDLERTQRVVLFGATAILDYLDREGLLPHRVEYGAPFFLGEPREQAMQKQP